MFKGCSIHGKFNFSSMCNLSNNFCVAFGQDKKYIQVHLHTVHESCPDFSFSAGLLGLILYVYGRMKKITDLSYFLHIGQEIMLIITWLELLLQGEGLLLEISDLLHLLRESGRKGRHSFCYIHRERGSLPQKDTGEGSRESFFHLVEKRKRRCGIQYKSFVLLLILYLFFPLWFSRDRHLFFCCEVAFLSGCISSAWRVFV